MHSGNSANLIAARDFAGLERGNRQQKEMRLTWGGCGVGAGVPCSSAGRAQGRPGVTLSPAHPTNLIERELSTRSRVAGDFILCPRLILRTAHHTTT